MKKLFIIRHAKSSWKDTSLDDFDRGLNKRGKKDIKFIANWLRANRFYPDLILSSPARRAKDTLEQIVKTLKLNDEIIRFDKSIYGATYDSLIDLLVQVDKRYDNLFLIGHNPALNELAEFLTNSVIFNIPTSGIFCVEFNISKWSEIKNVKGTISFFEFPKKLRQMEKDA